MEVCGALGRTRLCIELDLVLVPENQFFQRIVMEILFVACELRIRTRNMGGKFEVMLIQVAL